METKNIEDYEFYIYFNDEICNKYLHTNMDNFIYDINKQSCFDELYCDYINEGAIIYAETETNLLALFQFIADKYNGAEPFFKACKVDPNYISQINFEQPKSLSAEDSKQLNDANNNWQEEMNNYLMSNFDWIEYCVAQRETSFIDSLVANYIKFPKAENGAGLTYQHLQEIVDSLWSTDDYYKEKLVGPISSQPSIVQTPKDYYIIWNNVDYDEYDHLSNVALNRMYRY